MTFGTITNVDGSAAVRFERHIAAPIETVWRSVSDDQQISAWLAPTRLEPQVGGHVYINFGEDQEVSGVVTVFEPPSTLEYTWTFAGEPDSTLRIELAETDRGTLLTLEHRLLPDDQAAGYGAGWHAHLDVFTATVLGTEPVDWTTRFNDVLGSYTAAE